ncbi:MAG TPA: CotH kinase family protein [Saprospiraceae bacterium]|nr:CotH kinase family protein [Saprospiraceae bacterium]HNT19082.1 CotH kinase family protein [Saprospiraceae bacterium]
MNKILLYIFLFLIAGQRLSGQFLPEEYGITPDGRRLIRGNGEVKGLYDDRIIRRVDLRFSQEDWPALLFENYPVKKDIPASLIMEGKTYPEVGVRYKGYSSFHIARTKYKKSLNVTLDFVDESQNLMGYTTLNLHNGAWDPSFIKEVFFENLTRKYGPSLKASFVDLYLNGTPWGLYSNIQALDGRFLRQWFPDNEGVSWRAESPGLVDQWKPGFTSLNFMGEDSLVYQKHYTLKRSKMADPWKYLISLTRTLRNQDRPDSILSVLDVDRALWFLAREIVFEDHNGYVFDGGMDYFLYLDNKSGRASPIQYDNNQIFFDQPQGNWNLFMREQDPLFPLCQKLFSIPEFRQRYLAHVRTMTKDLFRQEVYLPMIERYDSLIRKVVAKDNKKLYPYSSYIEAIEDLKIRMDHRKKYILTHPEVNREGLKITDTEYKFRNVAFQAPLAGQGVVVNTRVSGPTPIDAVYIYVGTGVDGPFSRLRMEDDGKHQDGEALDGLFGAVLPAREGGEFVRFYLEAIAADDFKTATYDPPAAENDVYCYRVGSDQRQNKNIVINEVMSANTLSVADQDHEFDDWIELHNNSEKEVDLSRWILTDNPANLVKYRIPEGIKISGKGYLVLWSDEDGKQAGLHTNFKLSAFGEPLFLLDSTGSLVDSLTIPPMEEDIAYSRLPNGSGPFQKGSHSFGKENKLSAMVQSAPVLKIVKVAGKAALSLSMHPPVPLAIQIFNEGGQPVYLNQFYRDEHIDISQWPAGKYILRTGSSSQEIVIP